jgi:hypothetical protein
MAASATICTILNTKEKKIRHFRKSEAAYFACRQTLFSLLLPGATPGSVSPVHLPVLVAGEFPHSGVQPEAVATPGAGADFPRAEKREADHTFE